MRRNYSWYHRNTKDHKRILWIIRKQIRQSRRKNKFLETYNLRLNHEDTENRNRLITSKRIESVIRKLPRNKSLGPDGFTGKFYPTFKDLISRLLKLFSKNRRGGNTSKFTLQCQHYPDNKTRQRRYKKRKLQANIHDEHRCKKPQ